MLFGVRVRVLTMAHEFQKEADTPYIYSDTINSVLFELGNYYPGAEWVEEIDATQLHLLFHQVIAFTIHRLISSKIKFL